MSDDHGWRARPGGALLVRGAILAVPVLAGVAAAVVMTRLFRPRTPGDLVFLWILAFIVSNVVVFGVARQARRFLPLAALLELSLTFPDRTPSRMGVALRAGNLAAPDRRALAIQSARTGSRAAAIESVLALAAALSSHDRGTRGHSERVRAYSELLCQELHMPAHDRERLRWASLLHDVGKMAVPVEVLNKPDKPDAHEWEILKQHPAKGAELVVALNPWLGEWAAVVEQHHERWDGTGYPNGLAGTDIHRGARIVAVADAYEVMTAARPYKRPLPAVEARRRLAESAGSQFDPGMVRAFLNIGLGRMRLITGPLAWLGQLPFLRNVNMAARAPAQMAVGSLAMAAAVTAAVMTAPVPGAAPAVQHVAAPARPSAAPPEILIDLATSSPSPSPLASALSPQPVPSPLPLAAGGPLAAPASTPPPSETDPAAPPQQSPPNQPVPTPLVQVTAEVDEPGPVGLAVGVGDGGCTGVAVSDAVAVGCPPPPGAEPSPASAEVTVALPG